VVESILLLPGQNVEDAQRLIRTAHSQSRQLLNKLIDPLSFVYQYFSNKPGLLAY
jgi:hypothetical protein